jgi:hypothetical protein
MLIGISCKIKSMEFLPLRRDESVQNRKYTLSFKLYLTPQIILSSKGYGPGLPLQKRSFYPSNILIEKMNHIYNILKVKSLLLSLVFNCLHILIEISIPESKYTTPTTSPNSTTLDISIEVLSDLEKFVGQSNF